MEDKETKVSRIIHITPDNNDSNSVDFMKKGKRVGHGYQSKKDDRFHILRCPECSRENYALAISEGSCAFCGFNPNL